MIDDVKVARSLGPTLPFDYPSLGFLHFRFDCLPHLLFFVVALVVFFIITSAWLLISFFPQPWQELWWDPLSLLISEAGQFIFACIQEISNSLFQFPQPALAGTGQDWTCSEYLQLVDPFPAPTRSNIALLHWNEEF